MATIPREKLSFSRPRDESAVVQLMTNTALGMGAGLFMAVSSFTMKYPTIKGRPSGALFRGIAYDWVPGITAAAAAFTLVSATAESVRGVKDEVSSFYGGFAGGFTYGAIKMRSPVAPFIMGLIGGVAAGGADAWDRLSPSTAELGVKTDPRYDGAVAPSPQSLAASSSISSSVSSRLIK